VLTRLVDEGVLRREQLPGGGMGFAEATGARPAEGAGDSTSVEPASETTAKQVVSLLEGRLELQHHAIAGGRELAFDVQPAVAAVADGARVKTHFGVVLRVEEVG
jgi:hypothetical protein